MAKHGHLGEVQNRPVCHEKRRQPDKGWMNYDAWHEEINGRHGGRKNCEKCREDTQGPAEIEVTPEVRPGSLFEDDSCD